MPARRLPAVSRPMTRDDVFYIKAFLFVIVVVLSYIATKLS